MGSIGEEELFDQMVRDYYESESNTPNNIPSIIISSRHQSILQVLIINFFESYDSLSFLLVHIYSWSD